MELGPHWAAVAGGCCTIRIAFGGGSEPPGISTSAPKLWFTQMKKSTPMRSWMFFCVRPVSLQRAPRMSENRTACTMAMIWPTFSREICPGILLRP